MELRADHQSKVNEKERLVKKEKNWSVKSQTSQLIHKKKKIFIRVLAQKKKPHRIFPRKIQNETKPNKKLNLPIPFLL